MAANLFYAQSGGVTAVINATACGVIQAAREQGDVIGKVEVKLGDEVVHSADLVALEPVEEGGFLSRLWDSIKLFFFGFFN